MKTLASGNTNQPEKASYKRNMKKGLARGLPIVFGYFPIGFAFGILAANAGINPLEATLMSIFVFAGSAQLIAVGLFESQAGLTAIAVTTFLVNLRHLLMSAALAPYLGHLSRLQQGLFSFQLTDETFAVHSMDFKKEALPPKARIFATNMEAHLAWIISSFLGAWAGSLLTGLDAWGFDYALPAMFIALLVMHMGEWRKIVIAVFALTLSTVLYCITEGHGYIIMTTLAAATFGLLLESRKPAVNCSKETGDK